jgi:hypothetical protein
VRAHVDRLRAEREQFTENSSKLSDLTLLEKAMQEASKEHLTSTKRKKPGWYMARADKLEPLSRNRNTAQAAYNANPSDENKRRLQLVKKEVLLAVKEWIEWLINNILNMSINLDFIKWPEIDWGLLFKFPDLEALRRLRDKFLQILGKQQKLWSTVGVECDPQKVFAWNGPVPNIGEYNWLIAGGGWKNTFLISIPPVIPSFVAHCFKSYFC